HSRFEGRVASITSGDTREIIATGSTEHRRESSEWHCSHSRADSTLANRAVFGLPYPSPERKSLRNRVAQGGRSAPIPASCIASVLALGGRFASADRQF